MGDVVVAGRTPAAEVDGRDGHRRSGGGAAGRLAWLDALRGIGALTVALHHAAPRYLPGLHAAVERRIDPGAYGVIVFFLVSGYIIPASLERRGSLRAFWVGRVFRLHPLLCLALLATGAFAWWGPGRLREDLGERDPVSAVLAHLTTLQDLLGVPNALNVLWTLSYEMAFYFLVAALFAVGRHRRSAPVALGLCALGVGAGGLLPAAALTRWAGGPPLIAATALALAAALCAVASGRPGRSRAGAVLGGVLVATLVLGNGRIPAWQGLALLSLMFTGTVLYRAEHGQLAQRTALAVVATVWAACALSAFVHADAGGSALTGGGDPRFAARTWLAAVTLALLTFGAAMALRHRRVPRWLVFPGVISYSLYILHPLVLQVFDAVVPWRPHDAPLVLVAYLAVLLPLSTLSYHLVERPMQRLGRALAARPARRGSGADRPHPRPAAAGPGRG